MRQLSGNTTRTRKVFVGGLPPSVDETAFRWAGTLKRQVQAASASRSCRRCSTCPNANTLGPGMLHGCDKVVDHALPVAGSTLNSLERWRRQW